ncbi:MAG: methyltransferase domain-containing protein [Deltaproteobacteria bacterium]|nr:methyltransferase domain-containing protein [Deltaproteobacteria bacterium]
MKIEIPTLALALSAGCAGAAVHGGHEHHGHAAGDHFEHDFSDAAAWSKRFDDPARDEWQRPDEVVRLLELSEGKVAADIGAGTGYFLPHLSKAVGPSGKVWGLDVEQSLVAWMNDRATIEGLANVEAKLIAKDDPALEASPVDRILIVDTWHHIGGRDDYSQKLRKGLRPGGMVMVVDFTKDSPEGPPPEHRLPPEAVVETLTKAGFTTAIAEESLPRQYVVIGRVP